MGSGYNTKIHTKIGGSERVYESGSEVDFESGSAFKVASVDKINNIGNLGTGEVVTAINVITAAENGKTFYLSHAVGFASTLPAPAIGLKYKFVVVISPTSGALTVGTNAAAAVIEGMADVDSTLVLAANEKLITFTANAAIIGDWIEVESDGTSWFVTGQASAATGIVFTAP